MEQHPPNREATTQPGTSVAMADVDGLVHAARRPVLVPDLLTRALEAHDERPCFHLGEASASYREVREQASRFAQALQGVGVEPGTPVAVLSKNRPEVLFHTVATMVVGARVTPLHPLGSLDDHAHVCTDAGIEVLVYDAAAFGDHVGLLAERCPGIGTLLHFGADPAAPAAGDDYLALADEYEAAPLTAPAVGPDDLYAIAYTEGTTGAPKGVMLSQEAFATMTMIEVTEWEFPDELTDGALACPPGTVHVDCTADGLERLSTRLVFEDGRISLQTLRPCQQVFGAGLIGRIETLDHAELDAKNELATVIPHPDTPMDFLTGTLAHIHSVGRWTARPEIAEWLGASRLSPSGGRPPDLGVAIQAAGNLDRFIAEVQG